MHHRREIVQVVGTNFFRVGELPRLFPTVLRPDDVAEATSIGLRKNNGALEEPIHHSLDEKPLVNTIWAGLPRLEAGYSPALSARYGASRRYIFATGQLPWRPAIVHEHLPEGTRK